MTSRADESFVIEARAPGTVGEAVAGPVDEAGWLATRGFGDWNERRTRLSGFPAPAVVVFADDRFAVARYPAHSVVGV